MKILKTYKQLYEQYIDKYDIYYFIRDNRIKNLKQWLIDDGDINIVLKDDYTILLHIIKRSNVELMKVIIDHPDLDVNYTNLYDENALTLLLDTKPSKKVEMLKILLRNKNLDINIKLDYNYNIIQRYFFEIKNYAYKQTVQENNRALKDMILILIGEGVDLSNKDDNGFTIIDYVKNNDKEFLKKIKNQFPEKMDIYTKKQKSSEFNL